MNLVVGFIDQAGLLITGLFLLPLYFKAFGMELYGLWLASGGLIIWLTMFDLSSIINQRIAISYGKLKINEASSYFLSGMAVYTMFSGLVLILGFVSSNFIPRLIMADQNYHRILTSSIRFATLGLSIQYLLGGFNGFLNSVQMAHHILVIRPFGVIGQIVLVYFGLRNGLGLISIPAGLVIRNIILLVYAILACVVVFFKLRFKVYFKYSHFTELLLSSPYMFTSLALRGIADRFQTTIIAVLLSAETAAIYDASQRVALFIYALMLRITNSPFSALAHLLGEDKNRYFSVVRALIISSQSLSIVLFGAYQLMNPTFISIWIGSDKLVTNLILWLIAVSLYFQISNSVMRQVMLSFGDVRKCSWITFGYALLQILISLPLIKIFGLAGVPLSACIAGVFVWVINYNLTSNLLDKKLLEPKVILLYSLGYPVVLGILSIAESSITGSNLFHFTAIGVVYFLIIIVLTGLAWTIYPGPFTKSIFQTDAIFKE